MSSQDDRSKDDKLRAAILARRAKFMAAALSASGLVACTTNAEKTDDVGTRGGNKGGHQQPADASAPETMSSGDVPVTPTACLIFVPEPDVCLSPPEPVFEPEPGTCLSDDFDELEPDVCLELPFEPEPVFEPEPSVCLSIVEPEPIYEPEPSVEPDVCLSPLEPDVCLEPPFEPEPAPPEPEPPVIDPDGGVPPDGGIPSQSTPTPPPPPLPSPSAFPCLTPTPPSTPLPQ